MEKSKEKAHLSQLLEMNEEMRRQVETNVKLLIWLRNRMKVFLESGEKCGESGGWILVEIVAACRRIGKMKIANLNIVKPMVMEVLNKISPLSDTSKFIEVNIIDLLKSNVNLMEELTPEVRHILEKVDTPASLLEQGLRRVRGLADMREGVLLEGLPVILKTQVEHWPAARNSGIRETMDFVVQALGRIEHIV